MTEFVDSGELVEVINDLKNRIYDKHEVTDRADLELLLKELHDSVKRDCESLVSRANRPENLNDTEPADYIQ